MIASIPANMTNQMINLLTSPILTVRTKSGDEIRLSLPPLIVACLNDEVVSLPKAAAHQADAVLAALAMLAAAAAFRAGWSWDDLPRDPEAWGAALMLLTGGDAGPWDVMNEDMAKAAFLQSPVKGAPKWEREAHPDDLDRLVSSKNHELKRGRVSAGDDPEVWIYALISLQTCSGYSGSGNNGIARMNGGYGSRPFVYLTPSRRFDHSFSRCLRQMLRRRTQLVRQHPHFAQGGDLAAVWIREWDGKTQLLPSQLDPFFVEICRLVRLARGPDGMIYALRATTEAKRINTGDKQSDLKGDIGDPFAPFDRENGGMLTVQETGFDYVLATRLLTGGLREDKSQRYRHSLLQDLDLDAGDRGEMILHMSVTAGGQGKTAGWHERDIILPEQAVDLLAALYGGAGDGAADGFDLRQRSEDMIRDAGTVRNKLRFALTVLFQNGRDKISDKHDSVKWREDWLRRYDARLDDLFFQLLWQGAEIDGDAWNALWGGTLRRLAGQILDEAFAGGPVSSGMGWKAMSAASGALFGGIRKDAGHLMPQSEETSIGEAP